MKKLRNTISILLLISMSALAQNTLKKGDKAPDFTSVDQDGKTISLSQYAGKKVVLYFYPKDDTPGCTAQACNLRDNYKGLQKAGYVVLGVSGDDAASHKSFSEKYSLPFPLVVDTDKSINTKYGVWREKEKEAKKYFGTVRTTFVINEKGIITQVIDNVDTANHTNQILLTD